MCVRIFHFFLKRLTSSSETQEHMASSYRSIFLWRLLETFMRIALSYRYRPLVVLKHCNHHYIDMAAAASVNNKLEEARRKLRPFSFDNLPLHRNDGIWTEFRNPPYSLDLEELSAL